MILKNKNTNLGSWVLDLGEGIADTCELKVLRYKEAMERPDKAKWDESVGEEHQQMEDNGVFNAMPIRTGTSRCRCH